ncbi:hypothetical protein FOL47_005928 [Perkinsus chesapeaki]|uniref:Uncharacterized protein n=1 Tax=Perkinsus chesapeaki TaxID=330153 RepID=A0A7J6LUN6_PERCH|nr:hypothetical protein FOL47_005928 [Perkinsus chesapeaki]
MSSVFQAKSFMVVLVYFLALWSISNGQLHATFNNGGYIAEMSFMFNGSVLNNDLTGQFTLTSGPKAPQPNQEVQTPWLKGLIHRNGDVKFVVVPGDQEAYRQFLVRLGEVFGLERMFQAKVVGRTTLTVAIGVQHSILPKDQPAPDTRVEVKAKTTSDMFAMVEIDMTGSLESRDLRALGGIITGPNAIRSGEILVSRLLDGEGYEGSDHIDFVPTHSEVYDEFENKLAEASGLGNGSKAFIIYEGYLILAFGDPEKQVIKCIGFPVAPDRAAAAGMKIDVKKESVRSGRRKLR